MSRVKEIAKAFFILGCTAYGGPAVHIGMMDEEFVEKRKWLSREKYLDLIAATNLIPGPNSTEVALHIGYERAGFRGLVAAGAAFIFPAFVSTLLLAYFYSEYGSTPSVEPLLEGIKPAVLVIIAAAAWRLGKKSITNSMHIALGVFAVLFRLFTGDDVATIFACSISGALFLYYIKKQSGTLPSILGVFLSSSVESTARASTVLQHASAPQAGLSYLAAFFLKVGAILYGSGYVLISFLESELVQNRALLTSSQLLDAIAIGQFTPRARALHSKRLSDIF